METPGETADYGDIDPWRVDRGREACERPALRRKAEDPVRTALRDSAHDGDLIIEMSVH